MRFRLRRYVFGRTLKWDFPLTAEFLEKKYKMPVSPNHLFVSSGVSQILELLCILFCKTGDTVFVEEPTYFLVLKMFRDHGLRIEGIPTDENGLIVEALEERLRAFII